MYERNRIFIHFFNVTYILGDLWGPLVLCTFMAMILQGSSRDDANDGGPEFAEVFVIVWIGSMIVTVNSKLLGGNMYGFERFRRKPG